MSDSNQQTLQSYEAHVQEYIDGTPPQVDGDFKEWLDGALSYVSQGDTVLELGSAFGRDATYMEKKGFAVQRTDATESFVEYLRGQGHNAVKLNIITDEIAEQYDMIYASAVLLHLTIDELELALGKIYSALKDDGVFAFSVKRGDGSEWTDTKLGAPRFFQYWQPDSLRHYIEAAGFRINDIHCDVTNKWIFVTAQKEV